ncbi:MAG: hypothetical protein FWH38_09120, partial [Treponema sp.]|nr:hypothetical protein [Treponema sp.]
MKRLLALALTIAVLLVSCPADTAEEPDDLVIPEYTGEVNTYPWPDGMARHGGVTLTADGKNIDLYSVRANNTYISPGPGVAQTVQDKCDQIPVGMFDMDGEVFIA